MADANDNDSEGLNSSLDSEDEVSGFESDSGEDIIAELRDTIAKMSEQLAAAPDDVAALIFRGEAHFDLDEREQARTDLARALELESNCASTHFSWARFALAEGNSEEVLKHVQRAIEIDTISPGHAVDTKTNYADDSRANAQFILAEALLGQDRAEDALKAIDRAIELDDTNAQFLLLRGELKRTAGDFKSALADLERAVVIDPEEVEIRVELASTLLEAGEEKNAFSAIEMAFELAEREGEVSADLFTTRGEAYAAYGDSLRAREDFRRAIEIDADHLNAHLGLSELAITSRDFEIAERHLQRAEEIDASEPSVHFNRGVLAKARQDFTTAKSAFDKALEIADDYAEAYYLRGQVCQELGDEKAAQADYKKARDLGYDPNLQD